MTPFPIKSVLSPHRLIRWVELLLLIVLAVVLADLAWALFPPPVNGETRITRATSRGVTAGPAAQANETGSTQLSPAVLSLFGQAGHSLPVPAYREEALKETELDLSLKGILARRSGNLKLALIAQGSEREKVYRIGDRVAGADIMAIEIRRIVLQRNGAMETLTLDIAAPRRGNTAAGTRATEGITMLSDHERTVSRNLFDRQLQRLPEVLNQARTAPYWDINGQEAGFRVVDIEAGSVFEQLGLRQEDVIVTVNGVSVRNNREALAAYQSFKSSEAIQLGLLRDGQEVAIDFSIR